MFNPISAVAGLLGKVFDRILPDRSKINEAQSRINEAEGDAARFNAVFTEYEKAPEVTRQRLYLETMTKVVPSFQRRILMDGKPGNLLPLLQLESAPKPAAKNP